MICHECMHAQCFFRTGLWCIDLALSLQAYKNICKYYLNMHL
jgi:hypothetical protein